jgi:hypothetical protein
VVSTYFCSPNSIPNCKNAGISADFVKRSAVRFSKALEGGYNAALWRIFSFDSRTDELSPADLIWPDDPFNGWGGGGGAF